MNWSIRVDGDLKKVRLPSETPPKRPSLELGDFGIYRTVGSENVAVGSASGQDQTARSVSLICSHPPREGVRVRSTDRSELDLWWLKLSTRLLPATEANFVQLRVEGRLTVFGWARVNPSVQLAYAPLDDALITISGRDLFDPELISLEHISRAEVELIL